MSIVQRVFQQHELPIAKVVNRQSSIFCLHSLQIGFINFTNIYIIEIDHTLRIGNHGTFNQFCTQHETFMIYVKPMKVLNVAQNF